MLKLKYVFCVLISLVLGACTGSDTLKFDKSFAEETNKELYISDDLVKTAGFAEETASGAALLAASRVFAIALGQIGPALTTYEGQYLMPASEETKNLVAPHNPSLGLYNDISKSASKMLEFNITDNENAKYKAELMSFWGLYNPRLMDDQNRPFYKALYTLNRMNENTGRVDVKTVFECQERSPDVYTVDDVYDNEAKELRNFLNNAHKNCVNVMKKQIETKFDQDIIVKKSD